MGKRVIAESNDNNQHITPASTGHRNIRKRKSNLNLKKDKILRLNTSHNNSYWHENDDEDSSSNDGIPLVVATPRNASSKQANNSSILLNNSLNLSLTQNDNNSSITESPKPVYTLRPSVVNGTILYDLTERPWRLGWPIGKGNFGEIFLASDNIRIPVTNENAKFVVKIEPHSNGPLFVEIHCLMNTAKKYCSLKDEKTSVENIENAFPNNAKKVEPSGIPDYIASGSHYFGNARYRFLVLPRFDRDLHSIIKKCRVHQKSVLTLAIHIINVLENLHDRGYCHNDVKAQNLMISKCEYMTQEKKPMSSSTFSKSTEIKKQEHIKTSKYDQYDEKQQTTDSGNSSEQEANDEEDEDFVVKRKVYNAKEYDGEDDDESSEEDDEDEDFDDGATTNSMNSSSRDTYKTPVNKKTQDKGKNTSSRSVVQYSGSNPVRSCRRQKPNSIYDEMVKSHYLRPAKRVSYSEFFNEDGVSVKSNGRESSDTHSNSSGDESEEFVPISARRIINSSTKKTHTTNLESRRLTRRQEKLLSVNSKCVAQMHNNKVNCNDGTKNKLKSVKNDVYQNTQKWIEVTEERIFLIDYGLASKYIDKGVHRPFVMDQRRAHDGTLEFTSRDAHMGAHSRRSDMECLGYNLLFWTLGYLPWKEAATNQQHEKVHRAKEYLMTDVRELLIQIYGKQVPKYLGEYLHLVGQLSYHERPDYNSYRRIFEKEYQLLGYSISDLRLNINEIQKTCVRVKEEIENKNDFFETDKNNVACNMALNIMQNFSVSSTPFQERTLSNRVSPKNLRSKSDKKGTKKKKFSWTEILSQDPDQIARERAEKEFDREEELSEVQQPLVRRYQGKPTRTIVELLTHLGRSVNEYEEETVQLENEFKQKQIESKMELDECDNVKTNSNNGEVEDMKVDGNNGYKAPSCEDGETDTTEISEKYKRRKIKSSSALKNTSRKCKSNKYCKKQVARKLILKTPNELPQSASVKKNAAIIMTPVCARTRRKVAASTITDLCSPEPKRKLAAVINLITPTSKAKLAKSTTKKRDSANKAVAHKKLTFNVSSSATAASAAGEIEHNPQSSDKKRKNQSKRRLIKTNSSASAILQDDSNSNFSPDAWKVSTEAIYSRNCKKSLNDPKKSISFNQKH